MSEQEDLLIEIGTEELPPKHLQKIALSFAEYILQALSKENISYKNHKIFATPRRFALMIQDLVTKAPKSIVKRKGPDLAKAYKNGVPSEFALGFAKSCGVAIEKLSELKTDTGAWLYFEQEIAGKSTIELLPNIVKEALEKLPHPKKMRWGNLETTFIRPVHWILALYGKTIIPMEFYNIKSSNKTFGHRFMASYAIEIKEAKLYESALENQGKLIPDYEKRKNTIRDGLLLAAKNLHGDVILEEDLLNEVTALVEFPVVLSASFSEELLEIPKEALISAMQDHQRCFPILSKTSLNKTKDLLPKFLLVSNIEAFDPQIIINGNEKVMNARLKDAAFYYDIDRKTPLKEYAERLKNVIFQNELGTLHEKVQRVANLAGSIASLIDVNAKKAQDAAQLCKADLMTQMVYEFPELQGIMGYYYAKNDRVEEDIAFAIKEHYLPLSGAGELPTTNLGLCLSLADKLDSLVGFFGINKMPIKDKDPFALRRQALGIARILIEKELDLDLIAILNLAVEQYQIQISNSKKPLNIFKNNNTVQDVFNFCIERLKSWYQANGVSVNAVMAVVTLNISNLLDFAKRINATTEFSQMQEAHTLSLANKRVKNILEKNLANMQGMTKEASTAVAVNTNSDNTANIVNAVDAYNTATDVNLSLLKEPQEVALFEAMNAIKKKNQDLLAQKKYSLALKNLAALNVPLESFFEHVMVMCEDEKLKQNRLALLQNIRHGFLKIADISML